VTKIVGELLKRVLGNLIDKNQLLSMLKGALIAAAGAGLVYLSDWVGMQVPPEFQAAVAAAFATIINAVRKLSEK
jgi:hypothetical protein